MLYCKSKPVDPEDLINFIEEAGWQNAHFAGILLKFTWRVF